MHSSDQTPGEVTVTLDRAEAEHLASYCAPANLVDVVLGGRNRTVLASVGGKLRAALSQDQGEPPMTDRESEQGFRDQGSDSSCVDCDYCDGRGWVEGIGDHYTEDGEYIGSEPIQQECPACNGSGSHPEPNPPEADSSCVEGAARAILHEYPFIDEDMARRCAEVALAAHPHVPVPEEGGS